MTYPVAGAGVVSGPWGPGVPNGATSGQPTAPVPGAAANVADVPPQANRAFTATQVMLAGQRVGK